MTEERIRANFKDSSVRVSRRRYEVGARFQESTQAVWCYVLRGSCAYRSGDWEVVVHAGQFLALPQGTYECEAMGIGPLELVQVWDLGEPCS